MEELRHEECSGANLKLQHWHSFLPWPECTHKMDDNSQLLHICYLVLCWYLYASEKLNTPIAT
jgi:hypothetical protein